MSHVLIFESNDATADSLTLAFKNVGFSTTWLEYPPPDPARAVNEIQPDIITMDIVMRYMDGLQATKLITHDPRTHRIPLVIYSSIGSDEHIRTGLSFGATKYFVKSKVSPQQLVTECAAILRKNVS